MAEYLIEPKQLKTQLEGNKYTYVSAKQDMSSWVVVVPGEIITVPTINKLQMGMAYVTPIVDVVIQYAAWASNEHESVSAIATPINKIEELEINRLGVESHITDKANIMLNKMSVREAAKVVVSIIFNRMSIGLPVDKIELEKLEDIDAGLWEKILFVIHTKLGSKETNEEWDRILHEIHKEEENHSDKDVRSSLRDEIGIEFIWDED